MKPVFPIGILEMICRILMLELLLFQLAKRLNSQKTYQTGIRNEINALICIWILVIPIGIIEVTNQRK